MGRPMRTTLGRWGRIPTGTPPAREGTTSGGRQSHFRHSQGWGHLCPRPRKTGPTARATAKARPATPSACGSLPLAVPSGRVRPVAVPPGTAKACQSRGEWYQLGMDNATQRAAERAANKLLKAAGYSTKGTSLRQEMKKRREKAHAARQSNTPCMYQDCEKDQGLGLGAVAGGGG